MPKGYGLSGATKDGIWKLRAEGLSDSRLSTPAATARERKRCRRRRPATPDDVLRRRRSSEVRAVDKLPANKLFLTGHPPRATPPLPNRYPATQTHQPTAHTKKTCKMQA